MLLVAGFSYGAIWLHDGIENLDRLLSRFDVSCDDEQVSSGTHVFHVELIIFASVCHLRRIDIKRIIWILQMPLHHVHPLVSICMFGHFLIIKCHYSILQFSSLLLWIFRFLSFFHLFCFLCQLGLERLQFTENFVVSLISDKPVDKLVWVLKLPHFRVAEWSYHLRVLVVSYGFVTLSEL